MTKSREKLSNDLHIILNKTSSLSSPDVNDLIQTHTKTTNIVKISNLPQKIAKNSSPTSISATHTFFCQLMITTTMIMVRTNII